MPTDKKILNQGVKKILWALPLFFIGPTVIHSAFKNQDHPFFVPVLGLAIIMCILAVVLTFLGLKTIVSSMSDE